MSSAAGLKGALTITVHRARDLKDVQTIGKQDPYCVLQLGTEHFKTRVHNNGGINPEWEQSFLFNLTGEEDAIHIKINDSETLLDRPIGRVDVGLIDLINNTKNGPQWFMVRDVNNFAIDAGKLSISTKFDGTGLVASSTSKQPQTHAQPVSTPAPSNQVLINKDVVEPHPQPKPQPLQTGALYPAQQYQQQHPQQQTMYQQPMYQQPPQPQYQPMYQQAPQPQYQQAPQPQYQQPVYQQQQPMYQQPQQQPVYQQQHPAQQVVYTQAQPPSTVVYAAPPAVVVPPVQQVYVPPPVVIMPGHPHYAHPHHHPHHRF